MLNKYIFMAVIIAPNDTNANPNICSKEVAQSSRRQKPHLSLHSSVTQWRTVYYCCLCFSLPPRAFRLDLACKVLDECRSYIIHKSYVKQLYATSWEEMVQWLKYWPCKCEDRCSDPQNSEKCQVGLAGKTGSPEQI